MVQVDGQEAKKSSKVEPGQRVNVQFVVGPELSVEGEDIPLDILYEDAHIIAVNKPAGMVVHPAPGSWNGTFVNALVHHLRVQSQDFERDRIESFPGQAVLDGGDSVNVRPGIVHRLDKGTTGLLLAAKNPTMQAKLGALFARREVRKSYLTVCVGNPGQDAVIDVPIGRHPIHRQRMVAVPTMQPNVNSRRALSVVSTAAFDGKLSVAQVAIETGRTHQIRVHLQHRRTPVLGDETYGNKDWNRRLLCSTGLARPLLHAYSLEFVHPDTGKLIALRAPLPSDVTRVVEKIYPQVADEHPEWIGATPNKPTSPTGCDTENLPRDSDCVPDELREYTL